MVSIHLLLHDFYLLVEFMPIPLFGCWAEGHVSYTPQKGHSSLFEKWVHLILQVGESMYYVCAPSSRTPSPLFKVLLHFPPFYYFPFFLSIRWIGSIVGTWTQVTSANPLYDLCGSRLFSTPLSVIPSFPLYIQLSVTRTLFLPQFLQFRMTLSSWCRSLFPRWIGKTLRGYSPKWTTKE